MQYPNSEILSGSATPEDNFFFNEHETMHKLATIPQGCTASTSHTGTDMLRTQSDNGVGITVL